MASYIARQLIWHSREQRYYNIGEVIPLDHLDRAVIERLIAAGIVAESNAPRGLEDVRGIGREWARALNALGIYTLEQLIERDAGEIERTLGAVSLEQVRRWQRDARRLVGEVSDGTS